MVLDSGRCTFCLWNSCGGDLASGRMGSVTGLHQALPLGVSCEEISVKRERKGAQHDREAASLGEGARLCSQGVGCGGGHLKLQIRQGSRASVPSAHAANPSALSRAPSPPTTSSPVVPASLVSWSPPPPPSSSSQHRLLLAARPWLKDRRHVTSCRSLALPTAFIAGGVKSKTSWSDPAHLLTPVLTQVRLQGHLSAARRDPVLLLPLLSLSGSS